MSRTPWTDEKLSAGLLSERPQGSATEQAGCFQGELFWHLVRGELADGLRTRVLDHAAACPDCLLALRLARATSAEAEPPPVPARDRSTLLEVMGLLRRSLLHPAAAAGYLVLLLASFPLYRTVTKRPALSPAAVAIPVAATAAPSAEAVPELRGLRQFRMTGDLSLRGGQVQAPMGIPWNGTDALALRLFPDLEELPADPGAPLTIRILDGGVQVAAVQRQVAHIAADESLLLLLQPGPLRAGRTYRLELTSGLVETPVLRQSFRLDPEH